MSFIPDAILAALQASFNMFWEVPGHWRWAS